MPEWWWGWWILQWLGLVLMGGGLIARGLAVTQRVRREHDRRVGGPREVGAGSGAGLHRRPGLFSSFVLAD